MDAHVVEDHLNKYILWPFSNTTMAKQTFTTLSTIWTTSSCHFTTYSKNFSWIKYHQIAYIQIESLLTVKQTPRKQQSIEVYTIIIFLNQ